MLKKKIVDQTGFQKSIFFAEFQQDPLGFIDIGARGGTHSLVEPFHTYTSFLGFEPDKTECLLLNQNQLLASHWNEFRILPHALSNTHGKKTLKLLSALTNTSLLEPNERFINRYNMQKKWSITNEHELEVVPLDYIIYDLKLGFKNSGEIIKLDTQGTEYEILEGSRKLLTEKTVAIVSEVEFFKIYKDQKLFSDIEIYLRQLGFSFYGFLIEHTRSHRTLDKKYHLGKERLFYADAIFFRDPFDQEQNLSHRQYKALLISALLFGFFDFAWEMASSAYLGLSKNELHNLQELIKSLSYVNPIDTQKNLHELTQKITAEEENANVVLGKYIDAIEFPNFEDCILE